MFARVDVRSSVSVCSLRLNMRTYTNRWQTAVGMTRADEVATALRRTPKRDVAPAVQCLLWGRASGRCEFAGCNKPLWKSSVTQETLNIAEKAHIYAFSTKGPRGNRGISKRKINSLENLFLVCHECHRKIDREKNSGRYAVEVVRGVKIAHRQRG